MNTGIQEVFDLGWKLEAALQGWGGPKLLGSYEIERSPIAKRNIGFSTQNFKAWQDTPDPQAVCDDTEEGARVRAALGRRLRDSTRVEWESMGLQIGYRYEGSPICVPDGTPPTPDDFSEYVPSTRPGSRAPHAWLSDGRSTLDLFGRGFVLLSFNLSHMNAAERGIDALEAAFAQREMPMRMVPIAEDAIAKLYERDLVLVRPDGHIAWRGNKVSNAITIADTVRGAV